jgi:hypothetical protein
MLILARMRVGIKKRMIMDSEPATIQLRVSSVLLRDLHGSSRIERDHSV